MLRVDDIQPVDGERNGNPLAGGIVDPQGEVRSLGGLDVGPARVLVFQGLGPADKDRELEPPSRSGEERCRRNRENAADDQSGKKSGLSHDDLLRCKTPRRREGSEVESRR